MEKDRNDKNIGKKLDGRYEITERIGEGGMADVYRATDVVDNKTVAVKILKKDFAENEEFLRRFRNESRRLQCSVIRISSRSTMSASRSAFSSLSWSISTALR